MRSLKFIVYATTLAVVVYTLFSQLTVPVPLVFLLFIACTALLLYMIYRILKDPYKTQKTFSDWYQDKDIS